MTTRPTGEDLAARYLAPMSGRSRENERYAMRHWLLWCASANVHVLDADRHLVETWVRYLRETRGLKDNTIRGELGRVLAFYRWAHQEAHIPTNPMIHVRRPKSPALSTRTWLTPDECRAVLAAASADLPQVAALVHLLLLNGLRVGEAVHLDVTDIEAIGDAHVAHVRTRKNGGSDALGLSAPTVTAVRAAIGRRARGPLLLNPKFGSRMSAQMARQHLTRVTRAAGITRHITPHDLRTTFITLAREAGIPDRDISASAGHSTTRMLDYYDRLRGAVDRNATHELTRWLSGG